MLNDRQLLYVHTFHLQEELSSNDAAHVELYGYCVTNFFYFH